MMPNESAAPLFHQNYGDSNQINQIFLRGKCRRNYSHQTQPDGGPFPHVCFTNILPRSQAEFRGLPHPASSHGSYLFTAKFLP
jgi:hypothetical protein